MQPYRTQGMHLPYLPLENNNRRTKRSAIEYVAFLYKVYQAIAQELLTVHNFL